MTEILSANNLIALATLSLLEIVLGIDNIVFLSILTGKLPAEQRGKARRMGLALAMLMRIALLCGISWVMRLTPPLFGLLGRELSGRDLILLGGGLFLIGKATFEIHDKLEGAARDARDGPGEGDGRDGGAARGQPQRKLPSFGATLVSIMLLDIVFSLDSVITAVGMAKALWVMIAAIVLAVGVMMLFANAVGNFVERHPTIKMLALSFLILIGVMLVAESMGKEVEKGYVYFAMAFSLGVELLNLKLRKRSDPVHLHGEHLPGPDEQS